MQSLEQLARQIADTSVGISEDVGEVDHFFQEIVVVATVEGEGGVGKK